MSKSLLDFGQAAKYLNISRSTLYRLTQSGNLPGSKVGGQWRFRKERLDEWLGEQELNYKKKKK